MEISQLLRIRKKDIHAHKILYLETQCEFEAQFEVLRLWLWAHHKRVKAAFVLSVKHLPVHRKGLLH